MPRRGRPRHPSLLTPGEQRVLKELRKGGTNAEIAVRLGLSPETVKTHIASMLSKLDLEDRQQLASWDRDADRSRPRELLAIPVALGSLARPLMWGAAGTAVLAGAVAVAGVLVFARPRGEPMPIAPPDLPPRASPTVVAKASPQRTAATSPTPTPQATLTPAPTPGSTQTPTQPTPTPTPAPTLTPTPTATRTTVPAVLRLTAISDGARDAVELEWSGGPAVAATWQYRTRTWSAGNPSAWGDWTDIPDSSTNTRSYRVTDLRAGTAYEFAVRSVAGSQVWAQSYPPAFGGPGASSYTRPANDLPSILPDDTVEGDGVTQWRIAGSSYVIVIPDGMRLRAGFWTYTDGGYGSREGYGSALYHTESESALGIVFVDDDFEFGRRTVDPTASRDVGALFDEIEGSLTQVPHPEE